MLEIDKEKSAAVGSLYADFFTGVVLIGVAIYLIVKWFF